MTKHHAHKSGVAVMAETAAHPVKEAMTILIADDYPWICELIAHGLDHAGHHTLTALDGPAAREVMLRHGAANIDLLIIELLLPGINGRELADWFLANNPQGRVIMTSACWFASDLDPRTALLLKPFSHEVLIERINELFAGTGIPLHTLQHT